MPGIGVGIPHSGLTSLGATTALSTSAIIGAGRGASGFFQVRSLLRATPFGGGAGAGTSGATGGAGGGRLNVLCQGAISISATGIVSANAGFGGNGAGGGGGGVIVLASGTSVSNSGLIMAIGGDGGNGTNATAPGGGGGGGLIAMVAPSVASPGSESVDAGFSGITAGNIDTTPRTSGANGGASYGNGGTGGNVPAGGVATPTTGSNGAAGLILTKIADPAALFM